MILAHKRVVREPIVNPTPLWTNLVLKVPRDGPWSVLERYNFLPKLVRGKSIEKFIQTKEEAVLEDHATLQKQWGL